MQYLKVSNLTKSYTSKSLVDHVDFTISKNQKIAIVAKNGAGKSTLLKLLIKQVDITDWEIQRRKGIDIWYLSQESSLDKTQTVRQILFDFDVVQQWEKQIQLQIIIDKLQINPYLDQSVQTLSWWESKRVMLAKVLFNSPDMLILDEPTNHLDLDMIERLERYLKKQHTTLLMVTHDRYFLQRICTDIFELDRWKIYQYPGNYSYFLQKKAQREQNEQIQIHKLKQLFKKELDRINTSPQWRQTKANFREKRFYQIEQNYDSLKQTRELESHNLKLTIQSRHLGTKILKLKNIQKSFGDKIIIQKFSHEFKHGERIWIIWKNWVWKSTFINMLIGEEAIDSGLIQAGESVVFAHYEQKDIHFPDNKRLIDIVPNPKLLEQFLFFPNQQHQFAKTLSGGEKRRLYLLTILQKNPNFLILDEPTNDLDLITLWVLEDFLLDYKWCLIIVTHDRFFMDRLVDHLFIFEWNWVIQDFRWTYTQYKATQDIKIPKAKPSQSDSLSIDDWLQDSSTKLPKLSYMEKRELQQLGDDIQKLEKRKEAINLTFNDSDIPFDEIKKLSTELWDILKQLTIKESRRFELIERE